MSTAKLHLLKLCVGAACIDDLQEWQMRNRAHWPGGMPRHVTRMSPKRADELLDGGALYWVIKGAIQCRQTIIGLEQVTGEDGIKRCAILLDPAIIPTQSAPRRPFQGWRYLAAGDAPPDINPAHQGEEPLPSGLAESLAAFGLR